MRDAEAISDLGSMYSNGLFVKQDYAKALDYYEKAIEAGSSFALNQLGVMYFAGKGVERDYHAAAEYFKQAADLDDGYVLKFLAIMNDEAARRQGPRAGRSVARPRTAGRPRQPKSRRGAANATVRHVASGRTRLVVIRRYRFRGCGWVWC